LYVVETRGDLVGEEAGGVLLAMMRSWPKERERI
jgi:hypothetical protein